MFEDFGRNEGSSDRRLVASYGASTLIVSGAVALAVLLLGAEKTLAVTKEVAVIFTPRPAVPPPATPARPPIAAQAPPAKRLPSRKAPALVEPDVKKTPLPEADPGAGVEPLAIIDSEGTQGAEEAPAPDAPRGPPPSSEPKETPQRKEPISLPEHAVPPVADGSNQEPEYPETARAKGLQGQVILKIVIGESGAVERLEILRGDEPFASAAVAAVKTWRYTPARVDGRPAAVFRIVKIPFRLRA